MTGTSLPCCSSARSTPNPSMPGHLEVEDHAVHGRAGEQLEGLAPAGRGQHLVAADPLQVVGVLLRQAGDVVHDEDECHEAGPRRCGGQLDHEAGSGTGLGLDSQAAVQVENETPDDRETQAGAAAPWWCRSRRTPDPAPSGSCPVPVSDTVIRTLGGSLVTTGRARS